MNKQLKEQIWKKSKSAKDYPKDWLVIPAIDVIEILEEETKSWELMFSAYQEANERDKNTIDELLTKISQKEQKENKNAN